MFKFLKRSAKGAVVPHEKATAGMATVQMPVPENVVIPMSMHIGAPAEPVVKKGDPVMVGTLIGKAGGLCKRQYPFERLGHRCRCRADADGQRRGLPGCCDPLRWQPDG